MCCLNAALYAGCCACQACAQCCGATLGASVKRSVRIIWVIYDAVFVLIALLLLNWLTSLLTSLQAFISCPNSNDPGLSCLGVSAVFRMSTALVVMHLLILLFLLCRNECSRVMNEEIWCFKIFITLGVFIISFWLFSNNFYQTYSNIAMFASIFFLLFQAMMIIDLFYLWNETWVGKYDNGEECWKYVLIITTLILYGLTFWLNINSYSWFSCSDSTFPITLNLIFVVLSTVLVILGVNPNGSVMTTGAVSIYSSYLVWSGLTSIQDTCNTFYQDTSSNTIQLIVGLVVIMVSLLYVSINSSDNASGKVKAVVSMLAEDSDDEDDEKDDEEKGELTDSQRRKKREEKKEKKEEKKKKKKELAEKLLNEEKAEERKGKMRDYTENNAHIYFHLIMLAGSFYVVMLLTNWGNTVSGQANFSQFFSADVAQWVKISTGWFTMVLFIWTMFAPRLFPDRDFGGN